MSTLQVRNVPEDVQRILKARAAASGQSLSEYVLAELVQSARRPTLDELIVRIGHRGSAEPTTRAADVIREERVRR